MNKIIARAVLIIEIIVAIIFGAVLIDTCSIYRDANPSLSSIITVASLISAIIFPLAAHIVIRVKHRSNTPEGELLPFLFLSITFECVSFVIRSNLRREIHKFIRYHGAEVPGFIR